MPHPPPAQQEPGEGVSPLRLAGRGVSELSGAGELQGTSDAVLHCARTPESIWGERRTRLRPGSQAETKGQLEPPGLTMWPEEGLLDSKGCSERNPGVGCPGIRQK